MPALPGPRPNLDHPQRVLLLLALSLFPLFPSLSAPPRPFLLCRGAVMCVRTTILQKEEIRHLEGDPHSLHLVGHCEWIVEFIIINSSPALPPIPFYRNKITPAPYGSTTSKIILLSPRCCLFGCQVIHCFGTVSKTETFDSSFLQFTAYNLTLDFRVLFAFPFLFAGHTVLTISVVMSQFWQFELHLNGFIGDWYKMRGGSVLGVVYYCVLVYGAVSGVEVSGFFVLFAEFASLGGFEVAIGVVVAGAAVHQTVTVLFVKQIIFLLGLLPFHFYFLPEIHLLIGFSFYSHFQLLQLFRRQKPIIFIGNAPVVSALRIGSDGLEGEPAFGGLALGGVPTHDIAGKIKLYWLVVISLICNCILILWRIDSRRRSGICLVKLQVEVE